MNKIQGKIIEIRTQGTLSLITLSIGMTHVKSIIIDTPETASYLREGAVVFIMFKETEVILGKGIDLKVSLQNRLNCKIRSEEHTSELQSH